MLKKAVTDNYQLQAAFDQIPGYRHYVENLVGKICHSSTHTGGVVISSESLMDIVPMGRDKDSGLPTIQLDHRDIEKIGQVKFDILSLQVLDTIDNCVSMIEQRHNTKINWDEIGLDDEKTYELLATGNADGVFQFEKYGAQELIRKMEVSNFNELCAASALNRPGPISNHMPESYVSRKFGLEAVHYPHPSLEPVLTDTRGIFIFQEQVMTTAKVMAGYDDTEADDFRKAMGKKDTAKMEAQREKFINGCLNNGIAKSDAERVFNIIEKFAGYGFNRAHTVAYTIITYRMAYLKTNYPLEFMCAAVNTAIGNKDQYFKYIKEARRLGFSFMSPDINSSDRGMIPVLNNRMLLGLRCIKKVGDKVVVELMNKRPFSGMADFYDRINKKIVHKGIVENLIASGVFSRFGERGEVREEYYSLRKSDIPKNSFPSETEIFGFHVTRHPVEIARDRFRSGPMTVSDLKDCPWDETEAVIMINAIKVIQDRNGGTMAFIKIEDHTGEMDFVIFSDIYSQYGHALKEGSIYWVNVKRSDRGSWIVQHLETIRAPATA